jgi:hypothetical protein
MVSRAIEGKALSYWELMLLSKAIELLYHSDRLTTT